MWADGRSDGRCNSSGSYIPEAAYVTEVHGCSQSMQRQSWYPPKYFRKIQNRLLNGKQVIRCQWLSLFFVSTKVVKWKNVCMIVKGAKKTAFSDIKSNNGNTVYLQCESI